jgi:hypothetical protein
LTLEKRKKLMTDRETIGAFEDAEVALSSDGENLFITVGGVQIAKRGRPDRSQACTWIPLEPGWEVTDNGKGRLSISYDPKLTKVH